MRKGTHDKSWEIVPMQLVGNVGVGCGGGGGDGLGGGAPAAAVARRVQTTTKAMILDLDISIEMGYSNLLRVTHSPPSLIYSKV
jgi:hypothetical protein